MLSVGRNVECVEYYMIYTKNKDLYNLKYQTNSFVTSKVLQEFVEVNKLIEEHMQSIKFRKKKYIILLIV